MIFFLLINLKLLTIANSSLLNTAEHENFSANKYENANFVGMKISLLINMKMPTLLAFSYLLAEKISCSAE